jgi:hypothetical protein
MDPGRVEESGVTITDSATKFLTVSVTAPLESVFTLTVDVPSPRPAGCMAMNMAEPDALTVTFCTPTKVWPAALST